MATDFTTIALLFTLPIVILWITRRITAQLWVSIYLILILSSAVVVNVGSSFLWFLSLVVCIISSSFLVIFTALLVPPGQKAILPFLIYTERDPGGVGIDQRQTYHPSTIGEVVEIDIIAVNGLGSHPMRTWMAKDTLQPKGAHVSWLKTLLPQDFPNARVMSFQQDTSYLVNAPIKTIQECGEELLRGIKSTRKDKEERTRPILFIGHSFGGIVIKEALVQTKERTHPDHAILKSTIGILFLGTPHNGAWSTTLGDIVIDCTSSLGSNRKIMNDLRYRSAKLSELQRDFEQCYDKGIISIYEARKTRIGGFLPIMVVDEDLARISKELEHPIKLNTDHSGLNKFSSRDDGNYKEVVTKIKKLIDVYYKIDEENIQKCLRALEVSTSTSNCITQRRDLPKDFDVMTCRWVDGRVDMFCQAENPSRALLFRGSPGSGKSVMSRYIIDRLEKKGTKMAVFAFKDDSPDTSHAEPALRTLIRQMITIDQRLYRHIQNYEQEESRSGSHWRLEYLLRVFRSMISDTRCRSLVIILDALNECDDQSRRELFDGLASSRLRAGRFIITTQDVPDLTDTSRDHELVELDHLQEVEDAVEIFIDQKVDKFMDELYHKAMARRRGSKIVQPYQPSLRNHMLLKLKKNAGHMFLWAHLVMERLHGIKNSAPDNIKAELDALPSDLITVYEKIFQQVLKEGPAEVARKLPWILYAKRPLVVEELRDALAIQDYKQRGHEGHTFEGSRSDVVDDDLRKTFGSLVIVEEQTREVRLFHQTLRGALLGITKPPSEILRQLCVSREQAHADIAVACLDYVMLAFSNMTEAAEPDGQSIEDLVFLRYAARTWPYHCRQAGEEDEKMLKKLDELAVSPENMEFGYKIFNLNERLNMGEYMPLTYQLCVFGLEKLAIRSFQKLGTKQCQDLRGLLSTGEHILHAVAFSGFLKLLEIILETDGMEISVKDSDGQTMMHYATQGGQLDMVKYLIESGLSLEDPGDATRHCFKGFTPLHYAVYEHRLDVIELLLQEGASYQATDALKLRPFEYLHRDIAKDCHDPRCGNIAAKLKGECPGEKEEER